MIVFAVLAVLLVAGALLLVLPPLLRARADGAAARVPGQRETALAVLRDQLAELDAERAAGRMDEATYARAREELERRALDEGEGSDAAVDTRSEPHWALALAVGVPVMAAAVYLALGNLAGLEPEQVAAEGHGMPRAQLEQLVGQLATRLESEPDNLEGWAMLARSYLVLGDFPKAAATYERLAERAPNDADVLANWADAVAAAAGGQVDGEAERLVERALAIDPNHFKALALAGTAAFERADYAGAAAHWERILAQLPPDEEIAQSLRASIAEARAKGGLPPLAGAPAASPMEGAGAATPAKPAEDGAASPASSLRLSGEVRLAPELAAQAGPGDTVFVFVRGTAGRMPLAGLRLTAAELPARFDFSSVPLMMPGSEIPDQVVVGARVSKRGDAMAGAGDLEGFSAPVAPDARAVTVVIDRVR